jgi:hypothetical protein
MSNCPIYDRDVRIKLFLNNYLMLPTPTNRLHGSPQVIFRRGPTYTCRVTKGPHEPEEPEEAYGCFIVGSKLTEATLEKAQHFDYGCTYVIA